MFSLEKQTLFYCRPTAKGAHRCWGKKERAEASPVCREMFSCRQLLTIVLSQFPHGPCSVFVRGRIFLALYHCQRCLNEMLLSFMLAVAVKQLWSRWWMLLWVTLVFWLPGLVHNFLFKVLEDFWASVIKDSFKIFIILTVRWEWRLQCSTVGEGNQRICVRISFWESSLAVSAGAQLSHKSEEHKIYISDTLDV